MPPTTGFRAQLVAEAPVRFLGLEDRAFIVPSAFLAGDTCTTATATLRFSGNPRVNGIGLPATLTCYNLVHDH